MDNSSPKLSTLLAIVFAVFAALIVGGFGLALDAWVSEPLREQASAKLMHGADALKRELAQSAYLQLNDLQTVAQQDEFQTEPNAKAISALLTKALERNRALSWLGFMGDDGRMMVSVGKGQWQPGANALPWAVYAAHRQYWGEMLGGIGIALPVMTHSAQTRGILAAKLEERDLQTRASYVVSFDHHIDGADFFAVSTQGKVLVSPIDGWRGAMPDWQRVRAAQRGAVLRWPDGRDYLTVTAPVSYDVNADVAFYIVLSQPDFRALRAVQNLQETLLGIGLIAIALGALVGRWFGGLLVKPLQQWQQILANGPAQSEASSIPMRGKFAELHSLFVLLRKWEWQSNQQLMNVKLQQEQSEAQLQERTMMLELANRHLYEALTERERQVAQMESMERVDEETGLLNRRAFFERADIEIRHVRRHGSNLSIIILDVDHFKRVMDTYGHGVGEQAIRDIGRVLVRELRDIDVGARFAEEEFVLMLPDIDMEGALAMAERLRVAIRDLRIATPGGPITITASFGVAQWHDGMTIEATVSRADEALYRAKQGGRDRVMVWPA